MARIKGVTAREAGLRVRLAYFFTWRAMVKITGRATDSMLEPLQVIGHLPGLLSGYGKLEQVTTKLHKVDRRLSDLAELKAATLTNCEYCIDLGSQVARYRSGLTDEELLALQHFQDSPLFTDLEKLVMEYAAGISQTPVDVPDALFARLREHFDEAQLVELTFLIALENLRGRFNLALAIGSAGFSEGMVCAAPVRLPGQTADQ
jgi:AhpD family alkylhydroperoxidase